MRRRRTQQQDESDIDLTPMLDVVFIMLIFFIVTASFVKESALDKRLRPVASSCCAPMCHTPTYSLQTADASGAKAETLP